MNDWGIDGMVALDAMAGTYAIGPTRPGVPACWPAGRLEPIGVTRATSGPQRPSGPKPGRSQSKSAPKSFATTTHQDVNLARLPEQIERVCQLGLPVSYLKKEAPQCP